MSRGTVCGLIFFLKFWIILDFLQKLLAWFSNFYLRVQSKNCGGNGFFCFSFQIFFQILSENFSDFWPKNFKKLSKLPSACADEQFLGWRNFQKFWTVLVFLQKPLVWFSEFYLRVQSKISGRNSFLNFSFRIFSNFEQNIFRLLAKKLQEVVKTTLCVFRRTISGLNFFSKVLNRFGFSAETFGMVFKNPSSCPEWKLRKKYSFHSSFHNFFRILSEKFLRLLAKKLLEVFKTTFYVLRGTVFGLNFFLKIWIVLGFLQKPLARFSKFYLRVQSKNSGRNNFFILLFRIFSDFERKFFQIFGQKTSRSFQNYLLRVQRNSLWFEIFSKVFNRFGSSAETFGIVLKLLSSFPK